MQQEGRGRWLVGSLATVHPFMLAMRMRLFIRSRDASCFASMVSGA